MDNRSRSNRFRKTTDTVFLIIMTLFYIVLCAFIAYCIYFGDINRIIHGYDSCGNICSKNNTKSHYDCDAVDMTDKSYLLIRGSSGAFVRSSEVQRECVSNCSEYPNFKVFLNRCIPKKTEKTVNTFFSRTGLKDFFQEVVEDLYRCWKEILFMFFVSLGFSVIIIFLLRYLAAFVVWLLIIVSSLFCIGGTTYLWIKWFKMKSTLELQDENKISDVDSSDRDTYFYFAILATIVTVVALLVLLVVRKRIRLVIQLFKEAAKALMSMTLLIFQPILTFISIGVVLSLWLYFCMWIESSGDMEKAKDESLHHHKDFYMHFTRWFNIVGMWWMVEFIIGCQHMVVAGAVSSWYFTRNKEELTSPIFYSFYNLTRYHLGSVAFGSLLITIIQIVRKLFEYFQEYLKKRQGTMVEILLRICNCCLSCFEDLVRFLSRNAYIEVANHGYSFCQGARRAFKLILSNIVAIAAINSVGDFILFLGKILVIVITVATSVKMLEDKEGIYHRWVLILLIAIFAYFVSHCFFTVYEMTIDTIFLCFCEDSEENDGINRPYYMSRGLMEFVENSKKAYVQQDESSENKQIETISQHVT